MAVYSWIWRKLPGGLPGKILGSLILMVIVGALLFFYVFPWVEQKLPVTDVTVNSLGAVQSMARWQLR